MVGYISCGLLVLILREGLSGWGQGLGKCCRSGSGRVCDSGFDVVLGSYIGSYCIILTVLCGIPMNNIVWAMLTVWDTWFLK